MPFKMTLNIHSKACCRKHSPHPIFWACHPSIQISTSPSFSLTKKLGHVSQFPWPSWLVPNLHIISLKILETSQGLSWRHQNTLCFQKMPSCFLLLNLVFGGILSQHVQKLHMTFEVLLRLSIALMFTNNLRKKQTVAKLIPLSWIPIISWGDVRVQTNLIWYLVCKFFLVRTVLLCSIYHDTELLLGLLIFHNTVVLKVLSFT